MYPNEDYEPACIREYSALKESGNPLEVHVNIDLMNPIKLTAVLGIFLVIHVIDYVLYGFTQSKWDMWKVIHPRNRIKLYETSEKDDDNLSRYKCAWGKYVIF
jgi:hypothetical protein